MLRPGTMSNRKQFSNALRFLLIVLLLMEWLHAIPSFASSRNDQQPTPPRFFFDSFPVFSDFDGDNRIDQASLSSKGTFKNIHVVLGKSSSSRSLSFESSES